ncbi:MAG TPA: alpha-amylase family glycosyl hydrolase [Anaerolineales bacterium]|nr:alpha-amylase family glycosyl hydrolase [Anaerolineales bacterium]
MDDHKWWKDSVIYQIYPRSFLDTTGNGIGDLNGIIAGFDHLVDLGIGAIWLSPFYPTPDADFGYDVSDHCDVDPRFGSLDDFDELIQSAHKRNIKVILDLVLNHTSDQHPWFLESRSSINNPKRDWYIWRDKKNNWQAVSGGSGWEFDPQTGEYYYHMFLKEQPDVNWHNPEVRKAQLDVVRFWLDRGVDGFRLDVFNVYFKDKLFRDNPPRIGLRGFDRQRHVFDTDQPEMIPFLEELREVFESYKGIYSVGETFNATAALAAEYVGDSALHAAFSFDFNASELFFPWKPSWLLKKIEEREKFFRRNRWPTTVMSNHDTPRAASRYSHNEDDANSRLAMALLLTLRGTPFLYYGEEIGMRDIKLEYSEIKDPPGKKYWPFYKGRDGCRGPMQWNGSKFAGFSSVEPWLPVHPDFPIRNVELQKKDSNSLFHFTKNLMRIRKENAALITGSYSPLDSGNNKVIAYLRISTEQIILVVLNFSSNKEKIHIHRELENSQWESLLNPGHSPFHGNGSLELSPYEVSLLSTRK